MIYLYSSCVAKWIMRKENVYLFATLNDCKCIITYSNNFIN